MTIRETFKVEVWASTNSITCSDEIMRAFDTALTSVIGLAEEEKMPRIELSEYEKLSVIFDAETKNKEIDIHNRGIEKIQNIIKSLISS